jgi:hypothetical protein
MVRVYPCECAVYSLFRDDFILFPVLHDHAEEQSLHPVAGVHASFGAQYACQRHFV